MTLNARRGPSRRVILTLREPRCETLRRTDVLISADCPTTRPTRQLRTRESDGILAPSEVIHPAMEEEMRSASSGGFNWMTMEFVSTSLEPGAQHSVQREPQFVPKRSFSDRATPIQRSSLRGWWVVRATHQATPPNPAQSRDRYFNPSPTRLLTRPIAFRPSLAPRLRNGAMSSRSTKARAPGPP
jgi:hypothetical protein